ncbi:MAG: sulfatase [Candidatus Nanohaloarchaea archaeon]|nr:sulfatase [Candidatus Nanohaloarchaea archaeon]
MTGVQPNIVVLVLDTLRARNVSCYGYDRETTPELDRLASEGVQFTEAYTVAPWTLPAHASLFTGMYPSEHGADARSKYLPEDLPTLPGQLRDAGYTTVGVSNNLWLSPAFGTSRGFDRFELMWQYFDTKDIAAPLNAEDGAVSAVLSMLRNVAGGNPFKRAVNLVYGYLFRKSKRRAKRTNDRVLSAVDDAGEPYFLFVNYMEPHLPYRPPDGYAERFLPDDVSVQEARSLPQEPWDYVFGDEEMDGRMDVLEGLYDAAVAYLDEQVGELVDRLECRTDRPTVFLVLSDHGENIGDHGLMSHQYSLENTVLRVPLVMYGDGVEPGRIGEQRDLLDVHATLLDVAGVDADSRGTPLQEPREREHCFAQYLEPLPPVERLVEKYGISMSELDGREEMESVIGGSTKLIKFSDRTETRENTYDEPETDADGLLGEALQRWRESLAGAGEQEERALDETVKKRLEDLGYY